MFSCSICYEYFTENCSICSTKCGHVFHNKCLCEWTIKGQSNCPTCRTPIIRWRKNDIKRIFPNYDNEPALKMRKLEERVIQLDNRILQLTAENDSHILYHELMANKCQELDQHLKKKIDVHARMKSELILLRNKQKVGTIFSIFYTFNVHSNFI